MSYQPDKGTPYDQLVAAKHRLDPPRRKLPKRLLCPKCAGTGFAPTPPGQMFTAAMCTECGGAGTR